MQKKEYPLSLLKDIDKLLKKFQVLLFENGDIIEKVNHEKYLLYLRDREHHDFFFYVSKPNQSSDFRSFFNFTYLPQTEVTFENRKSFNHELALVIENFNIWVGLLREYNEINLTEEEYITKQYEEEFYKDFQIVDEDAYIKPFEHDKQIFLYRFLTYVETELKNNKNQDVSVGEIIVETQILKDNIQNLSKKNTIRKLAVILAKVKKHGIKLFQDVLKEGKKEIIKRVINGGLDELGTLLQ
jgi:hypothetical protein